MSGLKGMFDDEFRDLSASLRDAPEFDELAAVRSVRRRRTTRTMTVAAGGVLAVAAVGVGALAWGGGSDGGPATSVSPSPTPSVSASPSASPSPTPSQTVDAAPTLDDAGPGWFLLRTLVDGIGPSVTALAPDGTVIDVGSLQDIGATSVLAWHAGEVVVFDQEAPAGSFYPSGTVSRTDVSWRLPTDGYSTDESGEWVGLLPDGGALVGRFGGDGSSYSAVDDQGNEVVLCNSIGLPTSRALSPSATEVVCFDNFGEAGTAVLHAATNANALESMVELSREPWEYQSSGWLADREFLFAREGDDGDYVYFVINTDTLQLSDADIPLTPSDQLAVYDTSSQTYVRIEGSDVVFYTATGERLAGVSCAESPASPTDAVAYSGDRAVVMCDEPSRDGANGGYLSTAVWLVDLGDGGATEINMSAYPDGDYRTRALPYRGE